MSEGRGERRNSADPTGDHDRTLDLGVRGATVATAADTMRCDVGIRDRRIVRLREDVGPAASTATYEGLEVTGWPVTTIVRGRVVFDGGQPVAEAGHGTFLPGAASGRL